VLMILRPAGRFLTIPFPPGPFAARFLAAVILPPLVFFAILIPFRCFVVSFIVVTARCLLRLPLSMGCNPALDFESALRRPG